MKININEIEKKQILEQHNLVKKDLQSKLKKGIVSEQVSTPTGVEFLKAARDKKCQIAVGGVIKSAPGKPSVLYKIADYDSQKGYFKKGDELYIKDDYTFDVVTTDKTGKKTLTAKGKKWACQSMAASAQVNVDKTKQEGDWKERKDITDTDANVENPQMYEKKVVNGITLYRRKISGGVGATLTDDQKKIVDKWVLQGAKLRKDLDPEQAKTWVSKVVSPASEGYFSQDLIMYFDPEKTVKDATITTTIQNSIQNKIPTDQKDCKNTIEAYYLAFKKKRPLEPNEFESLKYKTQACKNEYYKDWGVLSGGHRMDNYLDIMSGGIGGPSSHGDNSKWRLN